MRARECSKGRLLAHGFRNHRAPTGVFFLPHSNTRPATHVDSRVDGRATREVRPISVAMRPLPQSSVHGSALFTRGETQALATVTLGDQGRYDVCEHSFACADRAGVYRHQVPRPGRIYSRSLTILMSATSSAGNRSRPSTARTASDSISSTTSLHPAWESAVGSAPSGGARLGMAISPNVACCRSSHQRRSSHTPSASRA